MVWVALGDVEGALIRTATVLVIACPHALGLAIPLVIAISTSLGARNGLLVKDRLALERARDLDVVIFDKTGTLTLGAAGRGRRGRRSMGATEDEVLALAAAVEADSEHPLARAIVRAATDRACGHTRRRGLRVDWPVVARGPPSTAAGSRSAARACSRTPGARALDEAAAWSAEGRTVLHVLVDGSVVGCARPRGRHPAGVEGRRSTSSMPWACAWP